MRVGIMGTGSYVPERILTNDDLAKIVDTNDEWITTRTGIRERRIAADDEATSDLAFKAAEKAIIDAGIDKNEIELIIVATMTQDHLTPSTAALVQDKLGIKAAAFDVSAACTGFIYGFTTGYSFIKAGIYKKVLVIGAETMSRVIDWEDRGTCILFGDGAGAVVLGEVETGGFLASHLAADGSGACELIVPAGGSRKAATAETIENVLTQQNLIADDIDIFIPHQANVRIIESIAKRFNQPLDKFFVNLHKYGNTSGASIPIALDEASKEGRFKKGDKIVATGFGGGLTYGSILFEWSK